MARRGRLAGMRPQRLELGRERRPRPAHGLDRLRRRQVGQLPQPVRAAHDERADRRHELRAVDEREALLRGELERRQAGLRQRVGPCQRLAADAGLALADEDEREVREGGKIAARAQRSARGDDGQHAGREHVDEELHQLAAHAGCALGERVRAQQRSPPARPRPGTARRRRRRGCARGSAGARRPARRRCERRRAARTRCSRRRSAAPRATTRSIRARDASIWRSASGARATAQAAQRHSLDVVDGQVVPGELDRRHVRREGYRSARPNSPAAAISRTRSGPSSGRCSAAPAAAAATDAGISPTSSPPATAVPCSAASRSTSRTTR